MARWRRIGEWAARAGLALLGLAPALVHADPPGIFVQSVRPGVIEAKPLASFTAVFRVANRTAEPAELQGSVELPEGWKTATDELPFTLAAGAEAIRLVSVFVPVRARADQYIIGYAVGGPAGRPVAARAELAVRVALEPRLDLQALELPPFAIAGDVATSRFLVINRGNAPLDVALDVQSNGFRFTCDAASVRVDAGEARTIEVTVRSDGGLRKKLNQQVRIKASASVPGREPLAAEALTQQDIIPRVYGGLEEFNKIPLELGLVALAGGGGAQYVQARIAGSGALDDLQKHKVDFFLRGPGRTEFNLFGLQREEYRFRYDGPAVSAAAGDKSFSLTNLTNLGQYGRGVEASLRLGRWSFRGYSERDLFVGSTGRQTAVQVGVSPLDRLTLKASWMSDAPDPGVRPDSRIFSLQSQFVHDLANVTLEYSWDATVRKDPAAVNSAIWLDANGGTRLFSYRANIIQSGADYGGYYQNLNFRSGEFTVSPSSRLQLRASYVDQRRNAALLPFFPPFEDRTLQAGLLWRAAKSLDLSLEERVHDRSDLSPDAQFSYRDTTLRAGALFTRGSLSVQNYLDVGRTYNELTRAYDRLLEYTVSANVTVFTSLSLGGFIHYRDQDVSFTGDKARRLEMNVNLGYQSGRTSIDAFYRTALHEELYANALSAQDFKDPAFLLNNYDIFGLNLSQRFGNGHQLGVRVQRAANPVGTGLPGSHLIGLLEYSIPLGVPVGRKASAGILRGRVYDADRGKAGVAGVFVRINDLATVTDPQGDFLFRGLEPGAYVLTLDERNMPREKVTVEKTPMTVYVSGGGKVDCSVGLTTGASIAGRIMVFKLENEKADLLVKKAPSGPSVGEFETGEGAAAPKPRMVESANLTAATVELVGPGDEVFHALTDESGRFSFEGLRPGPYVLRVFAADLPELTSFEKDTFELDLKPAAREQVDIKVLPVIRPIQIIGGGAVTIRKQADKR